MVHITDAGERRKALEIQARETARKIRAVKILGEERILAELESSRAATLAESQALEDLARLQDLHIYQVEKATKKGSKCAYWHCSWREGGKVRNVYLGSCKKMDAEGAREKARRIKAEALGIKT